METKNFGNVASQETVDRTIAALKTNNIEAFFVATGEEAKQKVLELLPEGVEVMTMTSETLTAIGVTSIINDSGKYNSIRAKFAKMDPAKDKKTMRQIGSAPDYTVGSVHAVTEHGEVMIASNSGSQLPAYVFGAEKVIWVVGTQKIVRDRDEGFKRIYEYTLPLESERAKKAYGVAGSAVNKMVIVNHENQVGRLTIIFVGEPLGF